MSFFTLSDDLLQLLLQEWLTLKEFVALDSAVCNNQHRRNLLRVAQQPSVTFDVGSSTWDAQAIVDYALRRRVTPRQLTFNWDLLQTFPSVHEDGVFSATQKLCGEDGIRELAETKTLFGGRKFGGALTLDILQATPWYHPEDIDEFTVDLNRVFHLAQDQFPSLQELRLSFKDYGCRCDLNLPRLTNLRVFALTETYLATPSSFFNMINTLLDLRALRELTLLCGWHPEFANGVEWDTALDRALQLSEAKRFVSLTSLEGSFDVISLLIHLCPQLKVVGLNLSKIFEDELFTKPLRHLSTYPFELVTLEQLTVLGYNPFPLTADNKLLNIEHLLRTATHLRTLNACALARHLYYINFEQWLTARTEPLTSLRTMTVFTNTISEPFKSEWFKEMTYWLPNVTEFVFTSSHGDGQVTMSALKPIEEWSQLKRLQLGSLSSPTSPSILDIGRFHRLETLQLFNVGVMLDDSYWIQALSELRHLQEWVWREYIDWPCLSSIFCEAIREQCPVIRVVRGENVWREIDGAAVHRMATSCRHLRELCISSPHATMVNAAQTTIIDLMNQSRAAKVYVLPEVTVDEIARQSVM